MTIQDDPSVPEPEYAPTMSGGIGRYTKAIVAGVTALNTWAVTSLLDGQIHVQEWAGLGGVVLVVLTTYVAQNSS